MMKCNVTICGVVTKAATCRTNKEGKPFVTFSVAVVIPAKNGNNKTIEVSVLKDGILTEVGNIVTGQRIEAVGVLIPRKHGENMYYNMNATAVNTDTTVKADSIVGQLEFRGKIGKTIDEKKARRVSRTKCFQLIQLLKQKTVLNISGYDLSVSTRSVRRG